MTTKTIPYDVAEQLRTPTEVAAYVKAWLDEAPDDVVGCARVLRNVIRAIGMRVVGGQR